ncbi:MAG: cobalamin-dependent protein, partial [Thiovulaceae bacterium]|nr:cobalamin-dependent protein [Sulfurimonadaceae bacterium]
MKKIVLTTLNSRYTHTAIALHYLYANMQELKGDSVIEEFTINEDVQSIAERILVHQPEIIGISVYIWNATAVHQLIEILKKIAPQSCIVLGGPEASHTPHRVDFSKSDFIIRGEGDVAFYKLCKEIFDGSAPKEQLIAPVIANLKEIMLPYDDYSDSDVANRYIYVEASRGCPFLCEFCLSAIDEKVRNFDIDALIIEFEKLWQRGARNFKFIDRTFNLNMKFANAILDFFLAKEPPYFVHFEVIPDHFPDSLKERIA